MAFSNTYAIILALMLITTGCSYSADSPRGPSMETRAESEDVVDMEHKSVQLMMDAGSIDLDSAQGTVETLVDLGASALEAVELVSNKTGIVLRAEDEDGQVYYLGFGGLGYLEIIRRDSADGEIIYAPED